MYNEERKNAFISLYATDHARHSRCVRLFSASEEFETDSDTDLCALPVFIKQEILNSLLTIRSVAGNRVWQTIKAYCRWCVEQGFPGAVDDSDELVYTGNDALSSRTVGSPGELAAILDRTFAPVAELTVDCVSRALVWLLFMGFSLEEASALTANDVSFRAGEIASPDHFARMYPESLETFHAVAENTAFYRFHPTYKSPALTPRAPGNTLLRGFRGEMNRPHSNEVFRAIKEANPDKHLARERVWYSGLFYRAYEQKVIEGVPVDFHDIAAQMVAQRGGEPSKTSLAQKIASTSYELSRDYNRWESAHHGKGG